MFDILGQTVRDIGIGAGGMTALAIVGLLVKRGISGTFSIGNGATQEKADAADGKEAPTGHLDFPAPTLHVAHAGPL